jgi:hypothetical protein
VPTNEPIALAPSAQTRVAITTPDGSSQGRGKDQEIQLLRSQVQALQNREANLLVRLNTQEEFDKQQSAANGKNRK